MRHTPNYLTSPKLTFDRDGGRLIAVEAEAVEIVDLARHETVRIDHPEACATLGFADQIWVASQDEALYRYTPTGTPIGEPIVLPFAEHPMLVPAPCGPATGVWGDVALHAEGIGAQLVRTALPPADLALPITHRHFAISAWRRLLLPSGIATPFDAPITGGAVLDNGSEAAIVLGSGAVRELALVALDDGQITTRIAVPPGLVRIAKRRGIVVVLTDPMTLVAIDLRMGTVLGTMQLAHPTRDIAIDPQGRCIALRGAGVQLLALDDLLQRSTTMTQPVFRRVARVA
ncbi:hypothetical protein BH11MYX1_BH11MYX1_19360 [soil metagenome]